MNDDQLKSLLDDLIDYLAKENPVLSSKFTHYPRSTVHEKYELYRAFVNERPPMPIEEAFLNKEAAMLDEFLDRRGKVDLSDLEPSQGNLYIWQGDITRLQVDGIVNAANSDMLGCTLANHNCIDNAIHTRAGIQLRLDCHALMQDQGHKEPMGKVKITKAYNLPSDYVLHTVGPYIDSRGVTPLKENLLRSSYLSCLETAQEQGLESVAFCCISTGEFNYPNDQAAQVAVQTVQNFLQENNAQMDIIFNVFKDEDLKLYQDLLEN